MLRIAGLSHKLDEAISTIAVDKRIASSNIERSLLKSELSLILEKWACSKIKAFVFGSFNFGLTGGKGILLIS